nr:MAG TPA: hypothetical protein [Caudoviricetes sp.]
MQTFSVAVFFLRRKCSFCTVSGAVAVRNLTATAPETLKFPQLFSENPNRGRISRGGICYIFGCKIFYNEQTEPKIFF